MARLIIARQESEDTQHIGFESVLAIVRLLFGSEEWTMLENNVRKSGSPILGVMSDVAPGGLQAVRPESQSKMQCAPTAKIMKMSMRNVILSLR